MKKLLLIVLTFISLFILFGANHETSARMVSLDTIEEFKRHNKVIMEIRQDFFSFMSTIKGKKLTDYDYCLSYENIAAEVSEIIIASTALRDFYDLITEKQDKEFATNALSLFLKRYIELLNHKIDYINDTLPLVKSPAIVTSANRLKDEIRKFKGVLESVRLP
jgi:hypothetical protein